MGKVDVESLESQPGDGVVQIRTVDADESSKTVTAAIDPEDDNESKEEKEKEIKDTSGANKDIDNKTEIIPDRNVVGNTSIIAEEAVEPRPKQKANSVDTT